MTQRSTLHMFRIIHTRDDISQKVSFYEKSQYNSSTEAVLTSFPRCANGFNHFIFDQRLLSENQSALKTEG